MDITGEINYATFEIAQQRSKELEKDITANPSKYRVLTGDRPTGNLHIGHYFGSLKNRVRIQNLGVETYIVIADYQVLTDRDAFDRISEYVYALTVDYLACGLDPEKHKTYIFPHSHVPELNQLLLPFLTLVSNSELNRNPTIKEEISASSQNIINAGMYVYPVHQAADILFCKSNIVPVGKDQLPHIELTRTIARRFNNKYRPVFREPFGLLSETPMILGLDGSQKMSKSRNNSIAIKSTAEETLKMVKTAKTDSERFITYDPENRPEVANLLRISALCLDTSPEKLAGEIGDAGAKRLKEVATDALNTYFAPIREKRIQLEKDKQYIQSILRRGIEHGRNVAEQTLAEVREAMNMKLW
ncbi:MAG: tryptophan--tRNA ligase [Bacteroidales bacterium]|jgi:tryptophanyl-tRNA synthetase|nr:tryptophan--tRNA ligase [Bacteroidales bacterium]